MGIAYLEFAGERRRKGKWCRRSNHFSGIPLDTSTIFYISAGDE